MRAPTALLFSVCLLASAMQAVGDQVEWLQVLSRIRTSSTSGLIYPANWSDSVSIRSTLGWNSPKTARDSAHWLRTLNDEVLFKAGGKALQDTGGTVLLCDQAAVRLHGLMTHPVKKGSYTGFEFLKQATAGMLDLSEVGFGGQLLQQTLEFKEDVPAQKLGDLMFFLCDRLHGNYWSLQPQTDSVQNGSSLPKIIKACTPTVLRVVP